MVPAVKVLMVMVPVVKVPVVKMPGVPVVRVSAMDSWASG